MVNWFKAESFPKRYWLGPKSQREVGPERGRLHCHHRNDFCIKKGSDDESHFNASLIEKDKVHRPQLLKRKESRSGIEPMSSCLPAKRFTARPPKWLSVCCFIQLPHELLVSLHRFQHHQSLIYYFVKIHARKSYTPARTMNRTPHDSFFHQLRKLLPNLDTIQCNIIERQHTRELISARKTSHKHNNKDRNCPR